MVDIESMNSILFGHRYTRLFNRPQLNSLTNEYFQPRLVSLKRWNPLKYERQTGHSVMAKVSGLGMTGHGIGSSQSSKFVATQKAISEAYERLVFELCKTQLKAKTSNGWAAHFSVNLARKNARAELFERDATMVQWLRKKPFHQLTLDQIPARLINDLPAEGLFKVKSILLTSEGFIPTASIVMHDRNGRVMAANGSGKTLEKGIRRAVAELIRFRKYVEQGLFDKDEPARLNPPLWQATRYLHSTSFPDWPFGELSNWRDAKTNWRNFLNNLRAPKPSFQTMAAGDLHVVRCTSAEVQDLYFGETAEALSRGQINISRLSLTDPINLSAHIAY